MGTPLEDPETKSIGVASGDFDGDGQEEVDTIVFWQPWLLLIHSKFVIYLLVLHCNHSM